MDVLRHHYDKNIIPRTRNTSIVPLLSWKRMQIVHSGRRGLRHIHLDAVITSLRMLHQNVDAVGLVIYNTTREPL